MTDDEVWAFLSVAPARPAVVATAHDDGRLHAVPVWYVPDGRTLLFTTGETTHKGRALKRDPALAVCVDDRPPFSFVSIEGTAALSGDLDEVRKWATVIGGRYMGAEKAEEFGRRNGVLGELLVRVLPRSIVAFKDVAD